MTRQDGVNQVITPTLRKASTESRNQETRTRTRTTAPWVRLAYSGRIGVKAVAPMAVFHWRMR